MKKILLTTIALTILATSSVFAASEIKSITPASAKASQSLKMGWDLNNSTDLVTLSNDTSASVNVYIAVAQTRMGGFPAPSQIANDAVVVTGCASNSVHLVQAGSFIACELAPSAKATIQIDAKNFINGSNGVYTTK